MAQPLRDGGSRAVYKRQEPLLNRLAIRCDLEKWKQRNAIAQPQQWQQIGYHRLRFGAQTRAQLAELVLDKPQDQMRRLRAQLIRIENRVFRAAAIEIQSGERHY